MPTRARARAAGPLLSLLVVAGFFLGAEALLYLAGVAPLSADRDPWLGFSRRTRVFELDAVRRVLATPPRAVRHSFNPEEFLADKPAGGMRVFVLGGSSARGFPWGGRLAFAHLLEQALSRSVPGRTVEVVNAAAMSYGSNRMRVLVHEILDYQPDLVIVYGGHNEFVESRFYRELIDADSATGATRRLLDTWRLYAAMARLLAPAVRAMRDVPAPGHADPAAAGSAGSLLGLDVQREDATETGDVEKQRVTARFRQNLQALLAAAKERGVTVLLCTVAGNLRDWAPNQSVFDRSRDASTRERVLDALSRADRLMSTGRAREARRILEPAVRLAPEHAGLQFALGRACEADGAWEQAALAYSRARDADAQPARALTAINDAIRQLAAKTGSPLADVERLFEQASPHGLVGFNLTEDYVHPNIRGHRLIARHLWALVHEQGLAGAPRAYDAALFDAAVGGEPPSGVAGLGPDASGPERQTAASFLFNLAFVLQHQGQQAQAIARYRECLQLNPGYAAAAFNLALLLDAGGDAAGAEEWLRRARSLEPDDNAVRIALGNVLSRRGSLEEATDLFEEATRAEPGSAMAWNGLGLALIARGRLHDAVGALTRSADLAPAHQIPLSNLGGALLGLGRFDEAIERFRAALAIQHDLRNARNGLAAALAATGRREEAEALYRESLARDPGDSEALDGLKQLGKRPGP
ncbi:MAG TPA: tetratricopeptide repeat protein [Candidatus Polarisedimenticolia bacterium]|nr:tetratricopeptide repeat protein [Candidatus Polarisedimenticolia bacterium]